MVENTPLLFDPSSLMWATVNASLGPDVGSVKLKPSPSATLEETSLPPASLTVTVSANEIASLENPIVSILLVAMPTPLSADALVVKLKVPNSSGLALANELIS